MIKMTVAELACVTGAEVLLEGASDVTGEVVVDSRAVGEGGLFVAFAGERVDGNAYLASAAKAGAAAVVASADPGEEALAAVFHAAVAPRAADVQLCAAEPGVWFKNGYIFSQPERKSLSFAVQYEVAVLCADDFAVHAAVPAP